MKLGNKTLIVTAFFALFGSNFAHAVDGNFELWNKHIEPLYYNVGYTIDDINRSPFQELRPGKWTPAGYRETTRPTFVAVKFGQAPQAGERIDVYTLAPNKNLIIRVGLPAEKEKFKETLKSWFGKTSYVANNYIFGPQTGPLLGLRASEGLFPFDWENSVNERGLNLQNNVTKDDITKSSIIYSPR